MNALKKLSLDSTKNRNIKCKKENINRKIIIVIFITLK